MIFCAASQKNALNMDFFDMAAGAGLYVPQASCLQMRINLPLAGAGEALGNSRQKLFRKGFNLSAAEPQPMIDGILSE